MANKEKVLVAAIDFGTTFSGYAYSFRHTYLKDPLQICMNQTWNAGGQSIISLKAPTAILLKPDKSFHSFGYEAENHYAELAEDNEHNDWYYFHQFKLSLHCNVETDKSDEEDVPLRRDYTLDDETGKSMPAKTVFAMAIEHLKNKLLLSLDTRGLQLAEKDVHWVVTIPAIWTEPAKQFMREAAVKAGIEDERLTLALEPEAASIYCKQLSMQQPEEFGATFISCFDPGSKYMIIDLGGGTVDVTAHEVLPDGTLKELHEATGGPWGGNNINMSFFQLLTKLFDDFDTYSKTHKSDFLDLERQFETKKRTINPDSNEKCTFRLPASLSQRYSHNKKDSLANALKQSPFAGKVEVKDDKLRFNAEVLKGCFADTIYNIAQHIVKLFEKEVLQDVKSIIMVGGFAESPIVSRALRESFAGIKFLIPNDPGLAVLKGAVIYGHNPRIITARISRFTYGIRCNMPFHHDIHPQGAEKVMWNEEEFVRDGFETHVQAGQMIVLDDFLPTFKYRLPSSCKSGAPMRLTVFSSTETEPLLTTNPSCRKLGKLVVNFQGDENSMDSTVLVRMVCNATELQVQAMERSTGKIWKAYFDFLA